MRPILREQVPGGITDKTEAFPCIPGGIGDDSCGIGDGGSGCVTSGSWLGR